MLCFVSFTNKSLAFFYSISLEHSPITRENKIKTQLLEGWIMVERLVLRLLCLTLEVKSGSSVAMNYRTSLMLVNAT